MKITLITIVTLSLWLAVWASERFSEPKSNQLTATAVAQTSPTPQKKEPNSFPAPKCSPQPTPLSEADKNDENREMSPSNALTAGLGTLDWDCDGVCNPADNCVLVYNPDQKDSNGDGIGNACDPKLVDPRFKDSRCDEDGDGIADWIDNCPSACNPDQKIVDVNKNNANDLCDSLSPNFVPEKPCVKRRKVKAPKPPRPAKASTKEKNTARYQ